MGDYSKVFIDLILTGFRSANLTYRLNKSGEFVTTSKRHKADFWKMFTQACPDWEETLAASIGDAMKASDYKEDSQKWIDEKACYEAALSELSIKIKSALEQCRPEENEKEDGSYSTAIRIREYYNPIVIKAKKGGGTIYYKAEGNYYYSIVPTFNNMVCTLTDLVTAFSDRQAIQDGLMSRPDGDKVFHTLLTGWTREWGREGQSPLPPMDVYAMADIIADAQKIAPFKNGAFNIDTGETINAEKAVFCVPRNYIPNPQLSVRMRTLLDKICCYMPDRLDYILYFVGASCTGFRCKFFPYLYNTRDRGNNGKSTLLELISAAFGDVCAWVDAQLLNGEHSTQLSGVKVALFDEVSRQHPIPAKKLKEITSLTELQFNPKNLPEYAEPNLLTLWIASNDPPSAKDYDEALFNRIVCIPCEATFTNDTDSVDPDNHIYEIDTTIKTIQWTAEELDNLVSMGFNKFVEWGKVPFQFNTGEVQDNREDLQNMNSPVRLFWEDYKTECGLSPKDKPNLTGSQAWKTFREWCSENNTGKNITKSFFNQLTQRYWNTPKSCVVYEKTGNAWLFKMKKYSTAHKGVVYSP